MEEETKRKRKSTWKIHDNKQQEQEQQQKRKLKVRNRHSTDKCHDPPPPPPQRQRRGGGDRACCHFCTEREVVAGEYIKCRLCPFKFCRRCLRTRHGEDFDIEMTDGGSKWLCPKCRKGCGKGCEKSCCTCVRCRSLIRGTGSLPDTARSLGFSNVHDYLIFLTTGESPLQISSRKLGKEWCTTPPNHFTPFPSLPQLAPFPKRKRNGNNHTPTTTAATDSHPILQSGDGNCTRRPKAEDNFNGSKNSSKPLSPRRKKSTLFENFPKTKKMKRGRGRGRVVHSGNVSSSSFGCGNTAYNYNFISHFAGLTDTFKSINLDREPPPPPPLLLNDKVGEDVKVEDSRDSWMFDNPGDYDGSGCGSKQEVSSLSDLPPESGHEIGLESCEIGMEICPHSSSGEYEEFDCLWKLITPLVPSV